MEGEHAAPPTIFPSVNASTPSGVTIKHVVPRSILVDLLDKARLWHNFTSDPTSAVIALLTKRLQQDGGLERYPSLLKLQQELKNWFGEGEMVPALTASPATEPSIPPTDNWFKVAASLPVNVQSKCEDLINKLKTIPHIIKCTPNGGLSVRGKVIHSSNMGDILTCLMRLHPVPPQFSHQPEKYWRNRGIHGLDEFVIAFAESNLPASLIRNVWFVKRIHKLRGQLSHTTSKMVLWSNK